MTNIQNVINSTLKAAFSNDLLFFTYLLVALFVVPYLVIAFVAMSPIALAVAMGSPSLGILILIIVKNYVDELQFKTN
ncbi:hypothetical protein PQ478_08645 [Alkalihalophilus pseudofirmus]|uniref:hypothetical protein n=1 Tax=Alkalihalophilus pseudofirmus TaxID=79885 RepID=UPI00259BF130|nr:hypothetical protein [Alkalihalophilus pseudofirmus]WEG18537.1 hypothetical protein PQ478_08645 [Alkalihalophilus pseudofirmus]